MLTLWQQLTRNPHIFQVFLSGLSGDDALQAKCAVIGLSMQDMRTRILSLSCVATLDVSQRWLFQSAMYYDAVPFMCTFISVAPQYRRHLYNVAVEMRASRCMHNVLFDATWTLDERHLTLCTEHDNVYALRQCDSSVPCDPGSYFVLALSCKCANAAAYWFDKQPCLGSAELSEDMFKDALLCSNVTVALSVLHQYCSWHVDELEWEDFLPYVACAQYPVFLAVATIIGTVDDLMDTLLAACISAAAVDKVTYLCHVRRDVPEDVLSHALCMRAPQDIALNIEDDNHAAILKLPWITQDHFDHVFDYVDEFDMVSLFDQIIEDPRWFAGTDQYRIIWSLIERKKSWLLQMYLTADGIRSDAFRVPERLPLSFTYALDDLFNDDRFQYTQSDVNRWLIHATDDKLVNFLNKLGPRT